MRESLEDMERRAEGGNGAGENERLQEAVERLGREVSVESRSCRR